MIGICPSDSGPSFRGGAGGTVLAGEGTHLGEVYVVPPRPLPPSYRLG